MLTDYINWQFVQGPRWLLELAWNFQKLFLRAFSVRYMLRTLIAPWHKDTFSYGAGLKNMALTFLWNIISRGIGLLIRGTVVATWLGAAAISIPVSATLVIAFLTWPLWTMILFAAGVTLTLF